MQIGQNIHRPADRPGHHLVEPAIEGVDQLGVVRVLLFQQPSRVRDEAAGILATVPFLGADGSQKMLHGGFVTVKQLAVEVARIPIDQHPAEVKDYNVTMVHAARCN